MISTVMQHPPYTISGEVETKVDKPYAILSFTGVHIFVNDPKELLVLSDICQNLHQKLTTLEVKDEPDNQKST